VVRYLDDAPAGRSHPPGVGSTGSGGRLQPSRPQALGRQTGAGQLEARLQELEGLEVTVLEGADSAAIRRHPARKTFHVLHFIGHGGFDPEAG